jgi:hypothetical protein
MEGSNRDHETFSGEDCALELHSPFPAVVLRTDVFEFVPLERDIAR